MLSYPYPTLTAYGMMAPWMPRGYYGYRLLSAMRQRGAVSVYGAKVEYRKGAVV